VGGNLRLLRRALTGTERGPELWTVFGALPAEEALAGADGVGTVDDDYVVQVGGLGHMVDAVADLEVKLGVTADQHGGDLRQVLFAYIDHQPVDLHHLHLVHRMFEHLPGRAAVAAADDEDILGVGVRAQGDL